MPISLDVSFAPLTAAPDATTVVLTAANGSGPDWGKIAGGFDQASKGALSAAAKAADFKAKAKSTIEILAPANLDVSRLIVCGVGVDDDKAPDWIALGGAALGQIQLRKTKLATLVVDVAVKGDRSAGQAAADLAMGALLRSYTFKKYLTKAGDTNGERNANGLEKLVIMTTDPAGARAAYVHAKALADGVALARDLVNEPANVLDPVVAP